MTKLKVLIHQINLNTDHQNISKVPKNKIGLMFNIEKYTTSGNISLYYKQRLETTLNLFKSNKIEFVIISNDNDNVNLKNDLIVNGISENKIHIEHSNFKNIDTLIIKVKRFFGLSSITIIS